MKKLFTDEDAAALVNCADKMAKTTEQLLDEIEFLFEKYSLEPRATTQPYHLSRYLIQNPSYAYKPADVAIREPLIEHVGSLPIMATTLYPYLADADVDLGQSLVMLAIHDIGELLTGDENTFIKKVDGKDAEHEAAIRLLHGTYHQQYEDVESQSSKSAKFAKSIDKITPDILDYLTPPEITIQRYKHFVGIEKKEIIDLIVKHKRPYMLWNPFMTEFHVTLIDKLKLKLELA